MTAKRSLRVDKDMSKKIKLQKPKRVKSCPFDYLSLIYPTESELDYLDELYLNELNINPGLKPKDIDTLIEVPTSKENYSNLSYRQKLLNFSKDCRLSGMNSKTVRIQVELWKTNYWGN